MQDNSSKVKSLLLLLQPPAKLFVGEQELPDLALRVGDLITTPPSFPLWPACADILCNSQSHVFVGVTYVVNLKYELQVRDLCYGLSDELVRYNDFTSEHLRSPYPEDDFDFHRLEIRWTDVYADKFEIAQLDSGFWYYSKGSLGDYQVTAFALAYIDEVLREYGLILPDSFDLPRFQPEFNDSKNHLLYTGEA